VVQILALKMRFAQHNVDVNSPAAHEAVSRETVKLLVCIAMSPGRWSGFAGDPFERLEDHMPYRLTTTAALIGALGIASQAFAQATPAPDAAAPAPAAAAPAAAAPTATARPVVAQGDLVETMRMSGQFTTFLNALNTTNLVSLLKRPAPGLTVFAPTDTAFAALPAGQLASLMANKSALQKLLMHHIINAPVLSSAFEGKKGAFPTGAGDSMTLDGSEGLKADNGKIVQADVKVTNGVLYVVDQVLTALPPEPPAEAPAAEGAPAAGTNP